MKLIKNAVDVWLKNHHVEFLSIAALSLVDFWSWLAQISKTLSEILKKVGACQSLRQIQEKVYFGGVKEFLKKHPPPPAHFCQWTIRHNKEIILSKTSDVCKKTKKAKEKLPSCKGVFWAGKTWGFQSIFVFLENFSTVTAFTKTHFSRRLQKFNQFLSNVLGNSRTNF